MGHEEKAATSACESLSKLMISAQDGDRVAYARLLRYCEPIIRRVARRTGVRDWQLDDAVQATLITLHHARATYDPARAFEAWLVVIARRRSKDLLRRDSRASHQQSAAWSGRTLAAWRRRLKKVQLPADAAIAAGLAGAGVIRTMSYQVADHVRDDLLQLLLEEFEPAPRPVYMVYDKQNRLPLKLRAFVDFVVPRLRDRLTVAAI